MLLALQMVFFLLFPVRTPHHWRAAHVSRRLSERFLASRLAGGEDGFLDGSFALAAGGRADRPQSGFRMQTGAIKFLRGAR
jgi:hypothetical protein